MIGYEISKPQIDQKYFLVSIRISKCYLYFYLTQILISLALLFSLISHYQTTASILQILACLLLGIDLSIRFASQGIQNFVKNRMNIIDISVFTIILCMIVIDFVHPEVIHHPQGIISFVVLILRYSIQLWRVIELSRESKKQLEINTFEEINLSNIAHEQVDISIHH